MSKPHFQLRSNFPLDSFPLWILLKHCNVSLDVSSHEHLSLVDCVSNTEIRHIMPIFEYLEESGVAVWPKDPKLRSECRHITNCLDHTFQLLSAFWKSNSCNVSELTKTAQESVAMLHAVRITNPTEFLFGEYTAADAICSGIVLVFRLLELERSVVTISLPVKDYIDKLFNDNLFQEWTSQNPSLGIPFQVPQIKTLLSSSHTAQILLASTSAFKIDAANRGFKGIYPGLHLNVIPVKADSEINAQPVGCEETLRGSLNRLRNAKTLHQQSASMNNIDFVLSIENGIVEATPSVWVDLAFIVVEHVPSNRTSIATSAGVSFPTSFVEQANKMGFQKVTVGSIMSKAANGKQPNSMDEANPHSYLTGQMKSRAQLLVEAIHIAVGQLTADPISQ